MPPDNSITVWDCPNCGVHMTTIVHNGLCKANASERTYVAVDYVLAMLREFDPSQGTDGWRAIDDIADFIEQTFAKSEQERVVVPKSEDRDG